MTTRHPAEKYFSVKLLFASKLPTPSLRPLCEERIVVIRAPNETAASIAAERYGHAEQHEYTNQDGDLVAWTLIRVEAIVELGKPTLKEGWEVASRYTRRSVQTLRPA